MITKVIIYALLLHVYIVLCDKDCFKLDTSITQRIEDAGFHREIDWLIEITSPSKEEWVESDCGLVLRLDVSAGMFVNPDQVAELNRTGKLSIHIDGNVDVEIPAHEATPHTVYLFLPNDKIEKISISLPIHLRYQRAQITGGFGKVPYTKPSLLAYCESGLSTICGKGLKVEAPCDVTAQKTCVYKNITYQALFEDAELYVPVGDLDDYPLVSIVSLLLGCAGCIYVLSILSTTPL